MSMQCSSELYLSRAISIVDFLLEDNGHSIVEAAKEFGLSQATIKRDINLLGSIAFYSNHPNAKELQQKYVKVKKILANNSIQSLKSNKQNKKAVSN